MRERNHCTFMTIAAVVTSIITIMSLTIALFVIMDKRKKKKEEQELEDYLETSIQ